MGKLARLLIPRKTQNPVAQPDYGTDMRAIEQWAQNVGGIIEIVAGTNVTVTDGFGPIVTVAATGGGTHYASLTGAGEFSTPGELDQIGPFTISGFTSIVDPAGGSHTASGNAIELFDETTAAYGIAIASTNGVVTVSAGTFAEISGGGGASIAAGGANRVIVGTAANKLGFFGGTGDTLHTVTGSRGGNAALASLLTALNDYGIIIDGSSP